MDRRSRRELSRASEKLSRASKTVTRVRKTVASDSRRCRFATLEVVEPDRKSGGRRGKAWSASLKSREDTLRSLAQSTLASVGKESRGYLEVWSFAVKCRVRHFDGDTSTPRMFATVDNLPPGLRHCPESNELSRVAASHFPATGVA